MNSQHSNPSINLDAYINKEVEINLVNGYVFFGKLYKSRIGYYSSNFEIDNGYWDECGKYMAGDKITDRARNYSIKSIKLLSTIKNSQPLGLFLEENVEFVEMI